jgi:hypothetical protein
MKTLLNSDIRLTDDLERRLLEEAIAAQQEYALDRAVKQWFLKVVSFFRAPEGRAYHTISAAR